MIPFILGALLAATLTLPAFARLIRQRDAAQHRGDIARAAWKCEQELRQSITARQKKSNARLMQQLDAQIEETHQARERIAQLEAEALPKAPNWGAAPAEWREQPDSREWLGMLR